MRLFLWTVLGVMSVTSAVSAQDDTESDGRARALFRIGDEHYAAGRYEDALAAFEESYTLSRRPLLLFDMANAHERMGSYEEAISNLQRYLPDASEDERPRISSRLESLRRRAARVRALTESPVPTEGPDERAVVRVEPPRAEHESSVSPLGLGLIVGGSAAIVGGVVAAFIAGGARDDLDVLCVSGEDGRVCQVGADEPADRDRRASIAADALLIGGAGVLLAGVLVWVLRDDEEGATNIAFTPLDRGGYGEWRYAF